MEEKDAIIAAAIISFAGIAAVLIPGLTFNPHKKFNLYDVAMLLVSFLFGAAAFYALSGVIYNSPKFLYINAITLAYNGISLLIVVTIVMTLLRFIIFPWNKFKRQYKMVNPIQKRSKPRSPR